MRIFQQIFSSIVCCIVHFDDQQALLFQLLHHVAEALEADLALVEIRVVGLNGRLQDRGIYAVEALGLEAVQRLA